MSRSSRVLVIACFLAGGNLVHAASTTYFVQMSVASGSYFLDWQLNSGGGGISNTALFTNLTIAAGDPRCTPTGTAQCSGSVAVVQSPFGVTLSDSPASQLNDYFLGITVPGNGIMSFAVTLSQATPASGQPDLFSFSLYNSTPTILGTTDPRGANAAVTIVLGPTISFNSYGSSSSLFTAPLVSVPEPSIWLLMASGFAGMLLVKRRKLALAALTAAALPWAGMAGSVAGHSVKPTKTAIVNFQQLVTAAAAAPVAAPPHGQAAPEPLEGPKNRKAPASAHVITPAARAALPPLGPSLPSPVVTTNFVAVPDNNTFIPPDTMGAVGPTKVMTTVNGTVAIQDRLGGAVSSVTLLSFWSSIGATNPYDPKILYDAIGGRFIFVASDAPQSANASVLMGVSLTSDPSGSWFLQRFRFDNLGQIWNDYPSVGYNKNWIVLSYNGFNVSNNFFNHTVLYAFNKANAYASSSAGTQSYNVSDFTLVPAITLDANEANEYIYLTGYTINTTEGLRQYALTGATPTLNTNSNFIQSGETWAGSQGSGDLAPQLGSANKISNNDARMQNCVYRAPGGTPTIWCTHTIFEPASGAVTRSAVKWYQFPPLSLAGSSTITPTQQGRIEDTSGTFYYAFPNIAVNQFQDVLIGFSKFSGGQFASANYAFRYGTDAANTMQTDVLFKAGQNTYFKTYSGTSNRWGDYSAAMVDPLDDASFWVVQEFAGSGGAANEWGTYWANVQRPCAPNVTSSLNITYGGYTRDRATGNLFTAITVTNTSSSPIAGPISLVFDNLTGGTLVSPAGTTACLAPTGSSYLTSAGQLDPLKSTTFAVQFTGIGTTVPAYTVRVIGGTGPGGGTSR